MSIKNIKKIIKELPARPGIYRFFDANNNLLYIGKAKNLKSRVSSYFAKTAELTPAKQQMVSLIKKIQFTPVANETEALLLERSVIKKFLPPFNVDLRDDKSWLCVKISKEELPKVFLTRKNKEKQTDKKSRYFGPYVSAQAIRRALAFLKKLFPYYEPNGPMVSLGNKAKTQWHLGRYLNEPLNNKKEWQKHIVQISLFLSGKNKKFKDTMIKEMKIQAKKKNFEMAAVIRDRLEALQRISVKQNVIKSGDVDEEYLAKVRQSFNGLEILKKILKLKNLPSRIEGYDISNIQGQFSVGSMAVLTGGEIDTSQYRRFKIKTVAGANDPAMIAEIIKRRMKRVKAKPAETWPKPDLMVIDGGPTQLNAAISELNQAGLKLPVISLAKKEEEIYLPGEPVPIRLPKFSPALQNLQKLRDEAHRFAISYYRKLHSKNFTQNGK